MNQYILSVLVQNHSGVLSRVAGLFSRRGYNIDSLTVGETENPKISRMTITVTGDAHTLEQIKKQLHKLIEIIKITELKPQNSVSRELILIKVHAKPDQRASLIETINIFRGKIIDVSTQTLITELTGSFEKINAFIELMKPFGIVELVRTGLASLERGNKKILDDSKI